MIHNRCQSHRLSIQACSRLALSAMLWSYKPMGYWPSNQNIVSIVTYRMPDNIEHAGWLKMLWKQIGARTSATTMLTVTHLAPAHLQLPCQWDPTHFLTINDRVPYNRMCPTILFNFSLHIILGPGDHSYNARNMLGIYWYLWQNKMCVWKKKDIINIKFWPVILEQNSMPDACSRGHRPHCYHMSSGDRK